MEGKETVRFCVINHNGVRIDLTAEFEEQAEISFKAGIEQERKRIISAIYEIEFKSDSAVGFLNAVMGYIKALQQGGS